ncbi:MAG: hypothetical protein WC488_01360 [Candidatus Micrarchaeia archaeon]
MDFKFFGKIRMKSRIEQPQPGAEPKVLYGALLEGLRKMDGAGVGRVVLTIYPCEQGSESAPNSRSNKSATAYRPFKTLPPEEQDLIKDRKSYEVVSLISRVAPESSDLSGVERTVRTRIHLMLPKLVPSNELNYVTTITHLDILSLSVFVKEASESGWTPEGIAKAVSFGITEWHGKTRELIELSGVHPALERLEARGISAFEKMMAGMRGAIDAAKSDRS